MSLPEINEKVEQLNASINATFDQALTSLRRGLQERLQASHQELHAHIESFAPEVPEAFVAHADLAPLAPAPPPAAMMERLRAEARGTAFAELRAAFAALDRARGQSDVLSALLAATPPYASRAAVLLWRGGELRGWGGSGFADSEPALRGLVLSPAGGSAWSQASWGSDSGPVRLAAADCAVLCGRIESPVPSYGFLVPIVLRDHVVALLYADHLPHDGQGGPAPMAPATTGDGAAPEALPLAALQSLVYVAELAIETLPFRQRAATATLAAPPAGDTAASAAPPESTAPVPPLPPTPPITAASPLAPTAGAAAVAAAESSAPTAPPASAAPASSAAAALPDAAATAVVPPAVAADAAPAADAAAETAAAPEGLASISPLAPSTAQEAAEAAAAGGGETAAGGSRFPGAPFAVTPATLYDTPSVPVVQQTAEIPRLAWVPPAESPYLEDRAEGEAAGAPAAAPAAPTTPPPAPPLPPAAEPGAAFADQPGAASAAVPGGASAAVPGGSSETVMLPRGTLRDAGAWGRRTSEVSEVATEEPAGGPPPQGLPEAGGPVPAASGFTTVHAPRGAAGAEAAPPTSSSPPNVAGSLRAVPPLEPLAPAPAAPAAPAAHAADIAEAGPGSLPVREGAVSGPVAVPPPAPAGGGFDPLRAGTLGAGTPEVRPPSGVQGPGWAFATTRLATGSGDEAQHEEARRLARLLVSEIKLYNEEQVEAGRRNRDIYERLREDIDRSRQMYEERVEPRLAKSTDYFYQELVRILAAGDSKALGI